MKPPFPRTVVVLFAVLMFGSSAHAMGLLDFAKMNDDDASTYVTTLVTGAARMLRADNKPDQAAKLMAFFKNPSKDGGLNELVTTMRDLNNDNNRNATNPNNRVHVFDVEDAMERTIRNHDNIIISASSLRTLTRDFRPIGPPRGRAPVVPSP